MSQNAVAPADGTGAQYETNVTNSLNTAFTLSSGPAAPSELLGYRFWADTANLLLKIYDPVSAAWIVAGYLGTTQFLGNTRPLGAGGQTAYENLSVVANAATSVLLTADDALVTDTATPKRSWRTGALALTVNLANSGALGLDTGASSVGAMYHLWAIYNPATAVSSAILSLAYPGSGSVTMPSGYTAKGYIGPIGLGLASSGVPDQTMSGNSVIMGLNGSYVPPPNVITTFATSLLSLPPNAREVTLQVYPHMYYRIQ